MGGWAFLSPAFLAGAAAIALPIVLHLLKRESSPPVAFSATQFVERAPIEQARRLRLREWLLLALRVSALLLLAFSFARPYLDAQAAAAAGGGVSVVAIDRSFSMAGPGRAERARQLARAGVDAAPRDHVVGLIAFDDGATVVVEPTADRRVVSAAIGAIEPGLGATRYAPAVQAASRLIGGRPGRVLVVTDLQRSGWDGAADAAIREGVRVDVADVGPAPDNVAVTAVRRDPAGIAATIVNTGEAPRSLRAVLTIDGRQIGDAPVAVGARGAADVRFAAGVPATGAVRVSIDDPAGLPADNARYFVLDTPAAPQVLLVASGRALSKSVYYIERALAVSNEYDVRIRPSDGLGELSADALRAFGAVFLMASDGLSRAAREAIGAYAAQGGGLLIAAGPDVDAAALRGLAGPVPAWTVRADSAAAELSFTPTDARHPIFRSFGSLAASLGRARFTQSLALGADGQVLARFSDGSPALTEQPVGRGRALVFASDLNNRWNNLPLEPTFVPFITELTRYLVHRGQEAASYTVSAPPDGVPATPGVAVLPGDGRRVALNVDASESNVSRLTAEEFDRAMPRVTAATTADASAEGRARESQQGYWRYGLMIMLATLALEGLVGRRLA